MKDVEGAVVGGRYELLGQVGAGGSGAVFRARDRVLDRDVAVKRMRPGADADAHARLRIEARLAGLLAHPGIVRVHDFGEEQVDGQRAPYLVLEYVDGLPLRDLLREGVPMAPERALGIIAQVAEALDVAHRAGIVHRDVKPSNILVRPSGAVALIDFGIARSHDVDPVTMTGTIVGTVDYISPEQAGGAGATALSDLYSLGLVAYECLTGTRALRRDTQVATVMAHVTEDVPPLPRSVPEPVRALVRHLTARDPRRRPADAATAARLARAALADLAAAGTTRRLPAVASVRRPRRALVLAAAAAAVTLGVGGWLTVLGPGAPGRAPAAAQADVAAPDTAVTSPAASTRVQSVAADVPTAAPSPRSRPAAAASTRPRPAQAQPKARGQAHRSTRGHTRGSAQQKAHRKGKGRAGGQHHGPGRR